MHTSCRIRRKTHAFRAATGRPSDSGKVVSAISGNVARERFDDVRPTPKLVSARSDENSRQTSVLRTPPRLLVIATGPLHARFPRLLASHSGGGVTGLTRERRRPSCNSNFNETDRYDDEFEGPGALETRTPSNKRPRSPRWRVQLVPRDHRNRR